MEHPTRGRFGAGFVVLLASLPLLVGCPEGTDSAVRSEPPAPENPLADTDWRLAGFQSMDDATGSVEPDDPSLYTMRLNTDGTVHMRLNCNRANGTWKAEPAVDGDSGSFEFGPLAMTRALCPPPSLDEQIASQSEWVRSFLLEDGRLHLSLMADGGIYTWEPYEPGADVAFETEPDAELEAAIRGASHDYTREAAGDEPARYVFGRTDLDDDGNSEVFVYLLGPYFCGTGGCNLLLFSGGPMGYSLIGNFPISRTPVIVSPEKTSGWRNLIRLESGGGAPPSYVTHTFDGKTYVEHQRSAADTEPEGMRVLVGEVTFESGIPLEPGD